MSFDSTSVYLDFDIQRTVNCKVMKVEDLSHWATELNNVAYIQITTPGLTKPVNLIFQKEKLNRFNSSNLNISDVHDYSSLGPLPDGLYTITLLRCEGDPLAVTKYFLQDCQIRCEITRKIIGIDLSCSTCRDSLLDKLADILLLLDAARAHSERCNPSKAMELYQRASKILDRIKEPGEGSCYSC